MWPPSLNPMNATTDYRCCDHFQPQRDSYVEVLGRIKIRVLGSGGAPYETLSDLIAANMGLVRPRVPFFCAELWVNVCIQREHCAISRIEWCDAAHLKRHQSLLRALRHSISVSPSH
jgi:hypothetical protein